MVKYPETEAQVPAYVHAKCREIMESRGKLPILKKGLCWLLSYPTGEKCSSVGSTMPTSIYWYIASFGRGVGYVGPPGVWNDERMNLLLLLAYSKPEDYRVD